MVQHLCDPGSDFGAANHRQCGQGHQPEGCGERTGEVRLRVVARAGDEVWIGRCREAVGILARDRFVRVPVGRIAGHDASDLRRRSFRQPLDQRDSVGGREPARITEAFDGLPARHHQHGCDKEALFRLISRGAGGDLEIAQQPGRD